MKMKAGALAILALLAGMTVGCDEHLVEGCGPGDKPKAEKPPAQQLPGIRCDSNPDDWSLSPQRRGPTRLNEVQAAAEAVQKAMPELFKDNKLVGECHASATLFWAAMVKEIRSKGLCAWPGPDAIHPASTVAGIAEEYHLINYGGCTLWPASRGNYKGDWVIK